MLLLSQDLYFLSIILQNFKWGALKAAIVTDSSNVYSEVTLLVDTVSETTFHVSQVCKQANYNGCIMACDYWKLSL